MYSLLQRRFMRCGRFSLIFVLSIIAFGLSSGCPAFGQTLNATLRGTVTDNSGAVVAGAEVTLLEPSTGQTVRKAVSSDGGNFEFTEIKPGSYELRCSMKGFKAFVAQNVILDSSQIRRIDPMLALGETAEEVTVSAGASVISTESPTISDMFTAKQHDQSPQVIIYPSIQYQLVTLAGVQGGTGTQIANGEKQSQQTSSFDGIANDLNGTQNNNSNFFEQVSATLFNASAESAVPVQVGAVTKRGQNAFHGKATYRIYDSVFNAKGFFNRGNKTPYLQHEWDLEASGPIWKDRTFFYGGWFAQRIPLGTFVTASVPTTAWRNGVFATTIKDPMTGQPFANNTIPASRISSVSTAVQNLYLPAPNVNTSTPVNNYAFQFPFNSDLYRGDWPVVRVDHNLTKNNSLFGRWLMRKTPYVLNNGLPALIWTRARSHQQFAAGDTQIFSPTVVNNFRFGYSIDRMEDGKPEAGRTPPDGSNVLSQIGLQGANPGNLTGQGFPSISISGLTSLTDVAGGLKSNNTILTLSDNVDWQLGQHALKIGGTVRRFENFYGVVPNYGTFTFDGSITGSAYADFLLGLPQQSQRVNPLGNQSQSLVEYGFYAEDAYKLTRKLTLTYGLRWDIYGTPTTASHLMYNWDPSTGNVIVDPKAVSSVSPLYPSNIKVVSGDVRAIADKTNIVPRLGVAYAVNDHTVVRAGYGIFT